MKQTKSLNLSPRGHPVQPRSDILPPLLWRAPNRTPSIIKIMQEELGVRNVKNPDQLVMVFDHVVPAATIDIATSQALVRKFAAEQGIRLYDVGRGVCHQVLVEERIAPPGRIVVGADSHSTTYAPVGLRHGWVDRVALIWAGDLAAGAETFAFRVGAFPSLWTRPATGAGASWNVGQFQAVEYHRLDWIAVPGGNLSSWAVEMGARSGLYAWRPDGAGCTVPRMDQSNPRG